MKVEDLQITAAAENDGGENETPRAAGHIELSAIGKIQGTDRFVGVIKFENCDDKKARKVVSLSLLRKQKALLDTLADAGYVPDKDQEEAVLARLTSINDKTIVTVVQKTGWLGNDAYAFEDKIEGPGRRNYLYLSPFDTDSKPKRGRQGTLEAWQTEVAQPAAASAIAMLAIGLALGSMIARRNGIESGGIHTYGPNSIGKTTIAIAANSVLYPTERGQLSHWDATATGLEQLTLRCNDGLLPLDEIGRLADDEDKLAKMIQNTSYRLAGGKGRIRSSQYDSKSQRCEWHLFYISNGEFSIADLFAKLARQRHGGDVIRFIDVLAHIGGENGIFDALPDDVSSAEAARQIAEGAEQNYGHAGRRFIREYLKDVDGADRRIQRDIDRFLKRIDLTRHGRDWRFAARFALAYAAAKLAIRFGVLPWSRRRLRQAITLCYRNALAVRPDKGRLIEEAIKRIRSKLQSGQGILDWRKKANRDMDKLAKARGFQRCDRTGAIFIAVKPAVLQKWAGGSVSLAALGRELVQRQALISQGRGLPTKQIMTPDGRRDSYYCFKASFYDAEV